MSEGPPGECVAEKTFNYIHSDTGVTRRVMAIAHTENTNRTSMEWSIGVVLSCCSQFICLRAALRGGPPDATCAPRYLGLKGMGDATITSGTHSTGLKGMGDATITSGTHSTLELDVAKLISNPGVPDGGPSAWLRVLAYAFCTFGTLGIQYAFGLLYVELLADMGAGHEEVALIGSGAMMSLLLFAPVAGFLSARFGSRRVCAMGGILAAAGIAMSAGATRPWHMYLSFSLLTGFGHSLSSFAPLTLIASWFDARLGLAVGVANSGTALAPLLLGPLAPRIFHAIGWRRTLLLLAAVDVCLLCGAAVLLTPPDTAAPVAEVSDTPGHANHSSGHSNHSSGGAKVRPTLSLRSFSRAACKLPVLYVATILLVYGLGNWVPIVHLVALGLERGLVKDEASQLLVFLALGNGTLRVPAGWAGDYFGRAATFAAIVASYAALDFVIGWGPHALTSSPTFLAVAAYLCGGCVGGGNVLTTTLLFDVLEREDAKLAVTSVYPLFGLGVAVGPVAAGALRTASGDYSWPIAAAGLALAVAAVLTLPIAVLVCRRRGRAVPGR